MRNQHFSDAFLESLGFSKDEIWEYGRLLARVPVKQKFKEKADSNHYFSMKQLFLQLLEESVTSVEQPFFDDILQKPLEHLNVQPYLGGRYFILYDQQQMGYERIEVDEIKNILFTFHSVIFSMKLYRLHNTWFYDDKIRHHELPNQQNANCPVCSENFYAGFDDFVCPSLSKIAPSLYKNLFQQSNFRIKALHHFPGFRLNMNELLQEKGYTFDKEQKKWIKDV